MSDERAPHRLHASIGPEGGNLCPRCEGTSHVRADSGLCERCHAVSPEAKKQWEEWREECARREKRRHELLPEGNCVVCRGPWYAESQSAHDDYCPAKPIACVCTRRFWDRPALDTHLRFRSCRGRKYYLMQKGDDVVGVVEQPVSEADDNPPQPCPGALRLGRAGRPKS